MLKPERRPFPIRVYNRLAVPFGFNDDLDFDKMIKKSRKHTGLYELGADFNDEALKILLTSINAEAQLNPFGKLMIREKLIGQLENRLWATHWLKKYPEILELEVLPIVLITGLQRTGTTKMQRLLSDLPGARGLMSWEALYPAPIKNSNETKKRIGRTRRNEKAVKWISPTFQSIHPIHADQPEEDVLLLDVHFMSSSSEAIMHVPSYASWLDQQDHTEAYEYEKKLLKLLQWQNGGKFWVLKSPHHLEYLEQFAQVFPGSQYIWMHRSVEESIPSFLSMLYFSRCMFSDRVNKDELKKHWLQKLSAMLAGGTTFRKQAPEKFTDVFLTDFMKDERLILSEIADQLSLSAKPKNMDEKELSKLNYVGKHKYQLSDWNLDVAELETIFADYVELILNLKKPRDIHD